MDHQTALANLDTLLEGGLTTTAPAIALAVMHRDRLVVTRVAGCLDPDTNQHPLQPTSRFDLASVTKLFTATAFLMLVNEGRVTLQDPVVTLIPEFGQHGPRPIEGGQDPHTLERLPAAAPTTIRVDPAAVTFYHLLTHTSGLAPWRDIFLHAGPIPPPPGQADPVSREERLRKALDLISGYPFVALPGQAVNYSDLGLILLGEAVARLDEVASPAEALHKRIIAPLGLAHTGYNPPDPAVCVPTEYDARWRGRRCRGEVHDETAASLGGIAGHAGLFSTATDVARFGQQWLHAVRGRADHFLPRPLAQEATRHHAGQRGLGWLLKPLPGTYTPAGTLLSASSFGHTGFTGTSLWIDPERELVVALLTNRIYHGREPDAISAFRPEVHDAICTWIDSSPGD